MGRYNRRNYRSRHSKDEDSVPSTMAVVSGRILKALRKFYDERRATFKSSQQARALQLIMKGKTDVLAILPTGGGKSLLFFLPTLMKLDMMTMVIVPLIAVMQDLRDRCVKAKISCASWDPHMENDAIFYSWGWSTPSNPHSAIIFKSCMGRGSRLVDTL